MNAKFRRLFLTVSLSAVAFPCAVFADVTGKVVLDGKAPDMGTINMSAIKECAALHPDPVTEETVIVDDKGGLKNVVVSLKLDEDKTIAGEVPKEKVVLDQKGCMYDPHVVAMMAGQDLIVKNSDPFLHNVHGTPKENGEFNTAMPTVNDGKKINPQPKATEIFRIKCDVHPWMGAWVAVFEHPYFAVTGDDGTYIIKGLPDGSYTLQAWHEKYQVLEQKVTVKDGKAEVNFTYKADAAPAEKKAAKAVTTAEPTPVSPALVNPVGAAVEKPPLARVVSVEATIRARK